MYILIRFFLAFSSTESPDDDEDYDDEVGKGGRKSLIKY